MTTNQDSESLSGHVADDETTDWVYTDDSSGTDTEDAPRGPALLSRVAPVPRTPNDILDSNFNIETFLKTLQKVKALVPALDLINLHTISKLDTQTLNRALQLLEAITDRRTGIHIQL